MYVVIRRYTNAAALGDAMQQRGQEVEEIIRGVAGFVDYYVIPGPRSRPAGLGNGSGRTWPGRRSARPRSPRARRSSSSKDLSTTARMPLHAPRRLATWGAPATWPQSPRAVVAPLVAIVDGGTVNDGRAPGRTGSVRPTPTAYVAREEGEGGTARGRPRPDRHRASRPLAWHVRFSGPGLGDWQRRGAHGSRSGADHRWVLRR